MCIYPLIPEIHSFTSCSTILSLLSLYPRAGRPPDIWCIPPPMVYRSSRYATSLPANICRMDMVSLSRSFLFPLFLYPLILRLPVHFSYNLINLSIPVSNGLFFAECHFVPKVVEPSGRTTLAPILLYLTAFNEIQSPPVERTGHYDWGGTAVRTWLQFSHSSPPLSICDVLLHSPCIDHTPTASYLSYIL